MIAMWNPVDQYKMLPLIYVAIIRANPNSIVKCDIEGTNFRRMLVAIAA